MKGVEFTFKNGEKENYEPIDEDQILESETEYNYRIEVGGYEYSILKENIESISYYDCCDSCGHELPGHCVCPTANI